MSNNKKLSLLQAIFININIMLGTGVFVNTVMLSKTVGALGGFLYLAAGLLMLPFSFCFAQLTQLVPTGNFYAFGSIIHRYWGFISTWSYFFGKLPSAALSIHVFVTFLQKTVPYLQTIPASFLDCALIGLFVSLNLLDIKTGSKIQYFFLSTKLLPVFFAIFTGLHYAKIINIGSPFQIWSGVPIALPMILFCFLGFEATCSLSRVIDNPQRNLGRAILISFFFVLTCVVLYQTIFFASMGTDLAAQNSFADAFPLLISRIKFVSLETLAPFISIAIGTAALGGAYGILYSNPWNLYTLAEAQCLPKSSFFLKLNTFSIPYVCVLTEGIICMGYAYCSQGAQIPLQYTAVLSCLVTYSISIVGLFILKRSLMSIIGLISCIIAISFSIRGFIQTSMTPLIVLCAILTLGTAVYLYIRKPSAT